MKKPSVTELVGLLNKPALLKWANKKGLQGIEIGAYSKAAKERGTTIHLEIEQETFSDPIVERQYKYFISDKKILSRETNIETEWFVGRYDCKLTWNGNNYIVDYKLGRGLYLEHKLQLIAYGMAESCDRFAVVHVPDFEFIDAGIELQDRKKYEEILIALAKIYTIKNDLKK